jgi:potassium/hydrogen antiporter
MTGLIEIGIAVIAALIFLGVIASKVSFRFGIPALLLFLVLGMLAGSDGIGGIYFDDAFLAQSLGIVALVLILFAGGLDTQWGDVRPVLKEGWLLATLGVFITAMIFGGLIHLVFNLSFLEALLLGCIISSTDAAAVFSVLRSKSISLKGKLRPLLELESGSNDPMAVFLTTSVLMLMTQPDIPVGGLFVRFLMQMIVGAGVGYAMGKAIPAVVTRIRLEYEGLYPVLTLALVLLCYGLASLMGGNGFLAVYLAGIVAGNQEFIHRRSLLRFHSGLAWLMQIAMFTTLGLFVFPSQLPQVAYYGFISAIILIFVARPLSMFICLTPFKFSLREKMLVSWVGLRGAMPIILATYPMVAGVPVSGFIFNVVFFVVLISTLLQGTTIPAVAKMLGVDAPLPPTLEYPLEYNPVRGLQGSLKELIISADSPAVGKSIMALRLPKTFLVVLIGRGDRFIIPNGGTIVQPEDRLLVISEDAPFVETQKRLEIREQDALNDGVSNPNQGREQAAAAGDPTAPVDRPGHQVGP